MSSQASDLTAARGKDDGKATFRSPLGLMPISMTILAIRPAEGAGAAGLLRRTMRRLQEDGNGSNTDAGGELFIDFSSRSLTAYFLTCLDLTNVVPLQEEHESPASTTQAQRNGTTSIDLESLSRFEEEQEGIDDEVMVDDIDGIAGCGLWSDEEDDMGPAPDEEDDDTAGAASLPTAAANSIRSSSKRPSPSPHSLISPNLDIFYRETRERLRTEMATKPSKMPSCYEAGQFSIPPKNPLFTTSAHHQITPKSFFMPEFFVWLPHVLGGKIPCPECKKARRTYAKKGGEVMLQHHSWPKAPRRVVDIDRVIYIIGYRYFCGQCKRTYLSWSPAILDVLPPALVAEFRFHLTRRSGVTDGLFSLLRLAFQRGLGPTPFAALIRTLHIRRFEKLQVQYYELVNMRIRSSIAPLLEKHQRFGAWDDREGYGGYVPSGRYFSNLYNMVIEGHSSEIDQRMAMLSARLLAIDHSHKVRISCTDHVLDFEPDSAGSGSKAPWEGEW